MNKTVLAVMLSVASNGLCQTPAKEPDTLQSLLMEVHRLSQEIAAMTVASQRVQIALYTLQMQDPAVARATQRTDDTRNKCKAEEGHRQQIASEIQHLEGTLTAGASTAIEAKPIQSRLTELKSALDMQTGEVQTCQAAEAETSSQLRNERAKLIDLQDRIERLDKTLEQLGAPAK